MSQARQTVSTSASGSRIESLAETHHEGPSTTRISATLRLRAENTEDQPVPIEGTTNQTSSRHIQWSDDVIDNEGMGKKSSKVCCIYHKVRPIGESSSESESSDSSASDSDSDAENETRCNSERRSRHHGGCGHSSHQHASSDRIFSARKTRQRKPSPNAYEKMPKTRRDR
ncbi:PPP1R11/YPI1 family protein [Aspergillus homomorphus CBS 101889]|uniref:Type 1 phosphatases regulator n=1 Tax=Aspergillus homomorphus (strain CBS 101889) TaxID=1450537 RepID=A0A395I082_ASPHC|nr:hypothetical protein BO97DRAFT_388108 [Aspergillus homomorphus CBS 101889]RAL13602.1 hypothetical protein BO97DRAFT_388108 [Aspergillus homomorphus CBS 101889]